MIPQSKGKMFLATERGHAETDWFRSYNTFQFGNYKHPDKTPFTPLYVLNNDTLAGGKSLRLTVEEDSDIIIIPTVGAIRYKDSIGNETIIEVGQAQHFTIIAGNLISFENPYAEDLVNFLQIWIKKEADRKAFPLRKFDFNLDENKNQLVELFSGNTSDNKFLIGKFKGRKEISYELPDAKKFFVYVIEGAFEVEYRLLETGDGLALWEINEVEIEALSNGAIILIIELQTS